MESAPFDADEFAELEEFEEQDDARLPEAVTLVRLEPGACDDDVFDSLSEICEECGESFRTEDSIGRDPPDDALCDHCYSLHYR